MSNADSSKVRLGLLAFTVVFLAGLVIFWIEENSPPQNQLAYRYVPREGQSPAKSIRTRADSQSSSSAVQPVQPTQPEAAVEADSARWRDPLRPGKFLAKLEVPDGANCLNITKKGWGMGMMGEAVGCEVWVSDDSGGGALLRFGGLQRIRKQLRHCASQARREPNAFDRGEVRVQL